MADIQHLIPRDPRMQFQVCVSIGNGFVQIVRRRLRKYGRLDDRVLWSADDLVKNSRYRIVRISRLARIFHIRRWVAAVSCFRTQEGVAPRLTHTAHR
jgi:hypothetical protein